MTTLTITLADLAGPPRYCSRGSRAFFERHGLDWTDFLKNGIAIDVVERIDDAMAQEVVRRAKHRLGVE